jgi:hypothetical protein
MAQTVECLPHSCEALSSNFSAIKKKLKIKVTYRGNFQEQSWTGQREGEVPGQAHVLYRGGRQQKVFWRSSGGFTLQFWV